MTGYSIRPIPPVTFGGVARGGGSEHVEWARNGPFYMKRSYTTYRPGLPLTSYYAGKAVFATAPSLPVGNPDSDAKIKSDGDNAINMARPPSPAVNILTSAGELVSDGLPRPPDLIRWRSTLADLLKAGKDAAGDYVAYQFAWRPLVSEIRAYYRQVVKADDIITRASSRAGQSGIIRVGYDYPMKNTNTNSGGTVNCYGWESAVPLGNLAPGGTSSEVYHRTWFEGKYLYFHPIPKTAEKESHGFADHAKYVLGLRLTPEVLWNLSPWSWFSDWLTNTDVVIGALSSTVSDGMVPVESFVMNHYKRQAVKSASGFHMSGDGLIARFTPTSTKTLSEQKLRFPSIPYLGFGGGVSSLTAKQVSILAAIGISH
jgi:hypothetical protein